MSAEPVLTGESQNATRRRAKRLTFQTPRLRAQLFGGWLALVGADAAVARSSQGAASPYREPAPPEAPHVVLDASRPGLHVQLNFPAAASAGPERRIYWLTGAEPLVIDVQLGVGPEDGVQLPEEVTGVLLLDGKQIPVALDGGRPTRTWNRAITRLGAVDRFALRVPGRQIRPGGHWVNLLLWRRGGRPFPSLTFAVMKDGTTFAGHSPSAHFQRVPPTGGAELVVLNRDSGTPVMGHETAVSSGRLRLELAAERDQRDDLGPLLGVSFFAFLDGQQISLGRLGSRPYLALAPGERVRAELDIPVQSRRATPATLVVFAFMTGGGPRLVAGGTVSGGFPPRAIGWSVLSRASPQGR